MSLNAFKEALKPCKSILTSSQSSSSSQSSHPSLPTRKPPKSSLSRQLLRLNDPADFSPPNELNISNPDPNFNDGSINRKCEEKEKDTEIRPIDVKLESFRSFDHTGPYEPLILSFSGEIPAVQVPASINSRLLEHQREGVKFLYNLYKNNHGGILGDDMGLGKTIQAIAFLAAVFGKGSDESDTVLTSHDGSRVEKKGPVLIICPSSVILNWESEFSKWSTFNVAVYHGVNRDLVIDKLKAGDVEIIITSFDTYRIQGSILSNIQWEILIVDEAHRLKNEKSKLYTACMKIKTLKRYGLTGTVMQNKIMELFNLFDLVAPGGLGTREHFREFYDEPLKHGQRSSAPQRFVQIAEERKQHLVSVLQKYMLRRTKDETIGHLMMGKEDNVVFCAMSELQKRVYQRILQLPDIQCLINKDLPCSCGSPLKQAECCQRTVPDGMIWPYLHKDNPEGCDSCPFCLVLPCLVKLQQISNHLELIKPSPKDDHDKQIKDAEFASAVFSTDIDLVGGSATQSGSFMGLSDVRHCGKMRALERLMHSWISMGDKILLFSYSVRMLDILEKFIIRKGYSFSRLDGSTPTSLRQSLVDDFNSSPSKQVFLISTRAGGLGLNLVSANRVVIFDPNWNPAQDLQAQDRSFRYGQKRHVTVFRLLSAGSLEELVYTRQVYKQQLSNIAVAGKMEKRYFEGVQDSKEFRGELFGICNLFRDLSDKLFTSNIVGVHDKQGIYFDDPPQETSSVESKAIGGRRTKAKPTLKDLGAVYAHRNEDVVNLRSRCLVSEKQSSSLEQDDEQPCPALEERKESDAAADTETETVEMVMDPPICDASKKRKNDHSSFLAVLMGIDEAELNKLMLA
ncbi:switch 2-like [Salvia splendens]|uniref:switch 2-like n=1 Tax=Salvia splendens TaxID=180675 RepID=UPI0010FFD4B3|nr:switch 2-like [Salvia splendens]